MAGVDVAGPGTGISFTPATKFAHSSGDAVQALGSGITLDRALNRAHPWGAPVVNSQVTAMGYQGALAPKQWFGGALTPLPVVGTGLGGPPSAPAGSLALVDAIGTVVVDAIVFGTQQSNSSGNGTVASPELATLEGNQAQGGCLVVTSGATGGAGRSAGRFPDGADADSNCTDFFSQAATNLAAASAAGANNIKISAVTGFEVGQNVMVGSGSELELATIASVGTPGATTIGTTTDAGATAIPVASAVGFAVGQTITIDTGANTETAAILNVGRMGSSTITVNAPLTHGHNPGAHVSGSGITFSSALKLPHAAGTPIATDIPTPGAPNKYSNRVK
jgi:hypothetical protein